jgi:hypothetical protein
MGAASVNASNEERTILEALRMGQQRQIELARDALEFAKSCEELRRSDFESLRVESRETARQALNRSRFLVRLYGVVMLLLGAILALLWTRILT